MRSREILFEGSGRYNYGTIFSQDTSIQSGAVLLIPGYKGGMSSQKEYASFISYVTSLTCMTVSLAGHGYAPGDLASISFQDHVDDLAGMYDYLGDQPYVDRDHIGVVGTSYGGYLAALLCNDRSPSGVLLRSPGIYADTDIEKSRDNLHRQDIDAFRDGVTAQTQNRALQGIASVDGPSVIVECELDETIKPNVTQAYLQVAAQGSHHVIMGAQHRLTEMQRLDFCNVMANWAQEL